mmetsp:Transcript_20162/g.51135  ORF Transcript_20162/g.51135 Transcript_20162/m.51135 type:complete len:164 (+) Transcript_20162:1208-1699(+)
MQRGWCAGSREKGMLPWSRAVGMRGHLRLTDDLVVFALLCAVDALSSEEVSDAADEDEEKVTNVEESAELGGGVGSAHQPSGEGSAARGGGIGNEITSSSLSGGSVELVDAGLEPVSDAAPEMVTAADAEADELELELELEPREETVLDEEDRKRTSSSSSSK